MKSRIIFLSLLVVGMQATFAINTNVQPTPQSISTAVDSIQKPKQVRIVGKVDADKIAVKNIKHPKFKKSTDEKRVLMRKVGLE